MSAEPALPMTGRCNCGAVAFEIAQPFVVASYCHCTRCQRRTGTAAALNGRAAHGSVRITQGEDRLRFWRPSSGFEKGFCADCGSHVLSRSPEDPDEVGIRFGVLDADPGIRPSYRQFVAYAAPWEPTPDDGLERFPESRPSNA